MSTRDLIVVWAALLGLLAVTVGASFALSGPASLATGLGVAFAKAALIAWFFMQLKSERGLVRVFAVAAAAWLSILLVLLTADYSTRGFG